MQPDSVQMTMPQMIAYYAEQIMPMSPEKREAFLQRMEADKSGAMPQMAKAIREHIAKLESSVKGESKKTMRPLPDQKPPRRANSPV